jgi:hypothetical protein
MDLIDRYLIAVRRQLPRNLEADIAPELTDTCGRKPKSRSGSRAVR